MTCPGEYKLEDIHYSADYLVKKLVKLPTYERKEFQVSKNFSWKEAYSGAIYNGRKVARHVEPPRKYWDNTIVVFLNFQIVANFLSSYYKRYIPIKVTSFFRTLFWNRHEDGASDSQHLFGKAMDSRPIGTDLTIVEYGLLVAKLCPDVNGLGISRSGNFVHGDIRDSIETWDY